MSHADMVKKLKKDMKDVLTRIPNSDDLVGIGELAFTSAEIQKAATTTVVKNMELAGDGGKYRLAFHMSH